MKTSLINIFLDNVKDDIKQDCKFYGFVKFNKFEYLHKNGFVFIVSHSKIKTSSMQKYHLLCYTVGYSKIFESSNVIDSDKFKSIDECIETVQNYFSTYNNKLNNL